MLFGLCTSLSAVQSLPAGVFNFVEENVQSFLVPEKSEAEFQANLDLAKSGPFPVRAANCFLPAGLKCTGPRVDEARLANYAAVAFVRAEKAGIHTIVFGSGGARQLQDGFPKEHAIEQLIAFGKVLAPLAQRHGVTVVIEPLNSGECNFINTLAEGAEIVRRVDHSNVRLLADIFHMLHEGEGPGEIIKFGELLHHVHVAERAERTPPGTAGDDFSDFFRALRDVGYSGPISIEAGGWKEMAAEVGNSFSVLRKQAASAGLM
ncbi:MAG: sugar phosphate isomerase/epimerase [Methylacidiphilales bacterium]|nr:sugar phosphate isomerase/epimerase [Candidatus Methylacidiphilales bacterium]